MKIYAKQNDGFSWILTDIDVCSKYTITYALNSKTAAEVRSSLKMAFYKLGDPQIIQYDNEKEFRNFCLIDFCKGGNIVLVHGRPRHLQSQSKIK